MMPKKGDNIIYINDNWHNILTKNKVYVVEDVDYENKVKVIDNEGSESWLLSSEYIFVTKKLSKKKLLEELNKLDVYAYDREKAHVLADNLLLKYINDPEIIEAYTNIPKWYA